MADTNQFTPGSGSRGKPGSARTGETGGIDSGKMDPGKMDPGKMDPGKMDPGQMIENAKNMGSQVIGAVQESATTVMDEQRNRAADQIATIADMVRNSVQSLDRQSAGQICQYADDTARQINDFADRLRTRSWGELATGVEDFARRWPVAFMASAVATGIIAGRFLVSSGSRATPTPVPQTTRVTSGMVEQPKGGARYDYGAVSGPVSGSGNSGYGSGRKETP